MIDDAEIRRTIAATASGESIRGSAARACFEALLLAQERGAPGPELVEILVAFHREAKALEDVVDELGA